MVKKSTKGKPSNRGYVGCRNDRLAGRLSRLRTTRERVAFVASFYSRLGEHLRLHGGQGTGGGEGGEPAWRSRGFRSRAELSGLRSLLYQSMFTTLQAHFRVAKATVRDSFGWEPGGGLRVPDEERPPMFRADRRFRPWTCTREGGCCLGAEEGGPPARSGPAVVPQEVEEPILTRVRHPQRFHTLEHAVDVDRATLVLHLNALQKEGKVKLTMSPDGSGEIHSVELTLEGRRRYWRYHNQLSLRLEEQILTGVLGKGVRTFRTLEKNLRNAGHDGQLLPLLKQLRDEGKVALPNLDERPRRPDVQLTNAGRRRLRHLQSLPPKEKRGERVSA